MPPYFLAILRARVFIINLLDCSTMYTFGNEDPFSQRGNLSYFDSSALVDAASDTLIYPGENGVLYLIRLGTVYDENAGTLSISPSDVVISIITDNIAMCVIFRPTGEGVA